MPYPDQGKVLKVSSGKAEKRNQKPNPRPNISNWRTSFQFSGESLVKVEVEMAKGKGRGDEHACRVNYLFQAGKKVAKEAPELSHYYGQVLTVITEKTAPKKDFTMKRSMCKKCHAILNVGENATYRLRKNKHKKGSPNIIITCKLCGEKKRLPTSKGYRLKAETSGQDNTSNGNRRESPPSSEPEKGQDSDPGSNAPQLPSS